jgi:hypothetical protein
LIFVDVGDAHGEIDPGGTQQLRPARRSGSKNE